MQASYQPQMMVMMVVVAKMVVQMMHAQLSSASEAVGLLDRVSSPISRLAWCVSHDHLLVRSLRQAHLLVFAQTPQIPPYEVLTLMSRCTAPTAPSWVWLIWLHSGK